ncbi:hypothetical protein [Saccharopolyspora thermophila]|uniref:hypothetical protein n=1 Tax=Saccharopolyspora thermophila TaxID=89367 RepID=UPI0031F7297F
MAAPCSPSRAFQTSRAVTTRWSAAPGGVEAAAGQGTPTATTEPGHPMLVDHVAVDKH